MKNSKLDPVLSLFLGLALAVSCALPLPAQKPVKKLTYDQAFLDKDSQLLMARPSIKGWLDDDHYLLAEKNDSAKELTVFKVAATTGQKEVFLNTAVVKSKAPSGFPGHDPVGQTADWSGLLYDFQNDLYFYRVKEGRLVRLTNSPEPEQNPQLSPNGQAVAFTRRNDLYTVFLDSAQEVRLTSDGSETILNGYASWVYFEEIFDRDYRAFWWSPDSRRLAFLRFDDSPVPEFSIFNAQGLHGSLERQRYPKAGDPNPKVRLGMVPAAGGRVVWADFEENADHYVAWPFWLPDSSRLTVQWMNRGQDHIKIFALDPATGLKSEVYDEAQPNWVEFFQDLYFLKDGTGLLLRSDKSGWRHLYLYGMDGRLRRQLTSGDWAVCQQPGRMANVSIALVDEKNKWVYFAANQGATTEIHLFRVRLDGTKLQKLTRQPGVHSVQLSPGGRYFLDEFSNIASPTRLNLCRIDGSLVRTVAVTKKPEMDEVALGRVELFTIPTSDGWNLPAQWILPPDFDPAKKYPVLFSIYGGPDSPRVSNAFPRLSSFYLAQEGIIFLTVDHRGAGHFGKKGTALMHRSLGKWEMNDWKEAVRWLRSKPFVDASRVGITGGSYGGYSTCLALTAASDFFTHGYARAPVIDWHLYDSVYTERYMDSPSENPDGYQAGSVLTYAPQFKGVLSFEHGALDDNVHAQNSIQFIDRLMDLDKDFSFMLMPKQRHGNRGKKMEFSNRRFVEFWFKHFLGR